MVKWRFNFALCMMFMLGMLGMHYAHAVEITIPEGYSLHVNDGTLHLPEEGINNAGTLQVTTGAIKLGGNWTNTGTFIPGTGNVELIGTISQTISGANTFYNLICTSAGNQLFFEAGKTQTVTANWTAMGNAGSYLVLRSTVNGTQWYVDPAGTRNVSYVDVKDSVNSSIPPINPAVWTDQGNNVNWITTQTNTATLVAKWEFDGDFTAANDSNYNGNPSGTVTFVQGKVGQAASFDGGEAVGSYNTTIDYVDSQKTTPASEFNGGFSIMGWIKPEDQVSGYFLCHDESCCTTSAYGFGAVVGSQGTVHLALRDSSGRWMFGESPVGAVPAGTWSHVALTWNGNTSGGIKIYINGQETTTNIWFVGTFSGLTGTVPLPLRIGAIFANSLNTIRGYVGSIDHISVWKGALSAEEILADYNNNNSINTAPVANAGADQSAYVGNTFTLNGSGSSDPEGNSISYDWSFSSKPDNSTAVLTNSTSASPTFTPDKLGTYIVSLTVNDGTQNSLPDTVTITVLNSAPVANAGVDQSVYVGNTVTLNGGNSSDVDGDTLTYSWTISSKPENSAATLTNATSVSPTLTADKFGTYVVSLTVNDGTENSTADTVTITTLNTAPVANAGPDQSVYVTNTVTLDGSESSDVDSDTLTYSWRFILKPSESNAALSSSTNVSPTFTVDKFGTYEIGLTVNDGTTDSAEDTVVINTGNSNPVANAGPDQSVYVNNSVTLDGGGSYDVDEEELTFLWKFLSKPEGSAATLSDATAVKPAFTVDVFGNYEIELMVTDGAENSGTDTVTISTMNSKPVANAGSGQSVYVNDTVTIDGSGSSDVDGDELTFSWAFVSRPAGSAATLSDSTAVKPTFTVDVFGDYVVRLTVNDGTEDSVPVTVTVTTLNTKPVANAGPGQSVYVNDTVTLDGSGSSDVDGNELTFSWAFTSRPEGSAATLSDKTAVKPTFTVDVFGDYVLSLTVNDGAIDSEPNTVTITTLNSKPVANAGPGQSVYVNDTVTLDGSESSDVDGDELAFSWAFTSRPEGSAATLSDETAVKPTFTVDVFGNYVVRLTVNDGTEDSVPVTVTVTTLNSKPVANAGPGQSAYVNDTVTLDGSGSSDVDGDELTFSWAFTSRPAGSAATLSDKTAVKPTFTVDVFGNYVVSLTVNDGELDSNPDPVTISTLNSKPKAKAGEDQFVEVNDTVTLDGSGSYDVDKDELTYQWAFTSRPAESTATLSNATGVYPTFVADKSGDFVVSLMVNDGTEGSDPDPVLITSNNPKPIADSGEDQSVYVGDTVLLSGSNSWDANGDTLTYKWSLISKPAGSSASLSDNTSVATSFTVDVKGDYIVQLIVNDGEQDSDPNTVTISTANVAPVANTGGNRSGVVGELITLDGSGSKDADNDPITYKWAFTSRPAGSTVTLDNETTANPSFTPDVAGIYVVSLTVNDGIVDSDPVTANISVVSQASAAISAVQDTITVINGLDKGAFNNPNNANALTSKLNAVIEKIENGEYQDARNKLQNDILKKTDGCATSDSPDKNDWVTNCDAQGQIYPLIMEAITLIDQLI